MTPTDFEEILQDRLDSIREILGNKAKEYATDGDRLHNFKVAAGIDGETQAEALWGMSKKHLVCIIDMVQGRLEPTPAMVDEKIGDMINYLILLEAVFKEDAYNGLPDGFTFVCPECGCTECVRMGFKKVDLCCANCDYSESIDA